MPEDVNNSLVLHPGSGLAQVGQQGGRVMAEMVSGALALSRNVQTSAALVPEFRIGEHVLCEPDYSQILLWASALEVEPETVVKRLLTEPKEVWDRGNKTRLVNGRLISLWWDLELLPVVSFEWVDGLVIESLVFHAPLMTSRVERKLSLRLPMLRRLDFGKVWAGGLFDLSSGFDLSAVPQLTELNCAYYQLTGLELFKVPHLSVLHCSSNKLTELNLSAVPHLTKLSCDLNELAELDLSAVPLLTWLSCRGNQLTKLELSGVSQLAALNCFKNQLNDLDIRPLENLVELSYDTGKTRLIQRPDQNF